MRIARNLTLIRRGARTLWCPLENPAATLPVRHWRWMWLAAALRPLLLLMVGVLLVPYYIARAVIWLIDKGGHIGQVNVICLDRDLKRSGWEPPSPPRVTIRLRDHPPPRHPAPGDIWRPWDAEDQVYVWDGSAWADWTGKAS